MSELSLFNSLPVSAAALTKSEEATSGGRKYAARLQLVSKGKLVDSGKVRPGCFAIIDGENVTDLGKSIDLIPLAVLDKALDVSGETPVVAFNRNNPEFKRIAETSKTVNSGCMYGPCFLVFERTSGSFLEIFFNNKSGRAEADKLKDFVPVNAADAEALGISARPASPACIKSKYIEREQWSWFAPEIGAAEGVSFDKTPTADELLEAVNRFLGQAAAPAEGGRDR